MSDFEKLFSQIKQLSDAITEKNYYDYSKKGYDILIRIYDMGITQEQVYSTFLQYYNSLQDGLPKEWLAEMLDYISGWCSPEKYIWKNDGSSQLQNRITAGTALKNISSVKLLKSLGFIQVGTEKVSFHKDENGKDIVFDGGIFELK